MAKDPPRSRPSPCTTDELIARLERSHQQIATVQVLSSALAAALTTEDVVQVVMEHTSILGASAGTFLVRVDERLEMRGYFGYTSEEVSAWQVVPLQIPTPLSDAARLGQPVALASRAELSERYPPAGSRVLREGAWLALPLRADVTSHGVLGLRFPPGRLPSPSDQDYLLLLAQQIGLALARAGLYEQAREQAAFEQKMLAIISHDLRTPLSAIVLASSMIKPQTTQEAALLERVRRSSMRMGAIIQNVLDLANQRAASSSRHGEPTDVDVLLADQCDELRAAFPGRTIELMSAVSQKLPFDPARLSQIVANLVRNALQHGDPTTPVTVTGELHEGALILSVHNFGPEIGPDDRAHLFEAFRRGSAPGAAGVGLGLYIVREMCQALGGGVEVESANGQTTFRAKILLPPSSC